MIVVVAVVDIDLVNALVVVGVWFVNELQTSAGG